MRKNKMAKRQRQSAGKGGNKRYKLLTDAENGLKVTKGIAAAFKKQKKNDGKVEPVSERESTSSIDQINDVIVPRAPELTKEELEILKQFDLNWKFGPSIGITRRQRWTRAQKLGRNPPFNVKDILWAVDENSGINQCIWKEYKQLI